MNILYKKTIVGREVIAIKEVIDILLKVTPVPLVNSSYRTLETQKILFQQGKSKTLQSNHCRGRSVDCAVNWRFIQKSMRDNGLINDVPWDSNHFSLQGEALASTFPIITNPVIINYSEFPDSSKPMRYVITPSQDQYLLKDDFPQIAFHISLEMLQAMQAKGFKEQPLSIPALPVNYLIWK